MTSRFFQAAFISAILFSALPAWAANPHTRTPSPRPSGAPAELVGATTAQAISKTIDLLQEQVYRKNRSKAARALKKAYDALQAEQFSRARELSLGLQRGTLFSDYGFWISAQADRGNAAAALQQNNLAEALRQADRSINDFHRIESSNPYSPLVKQVQKEIGLSELLKGEIHWALLQWNLSAAAFERGFLRLQGASDFDDVLPVHLSRYAESCARIHRGKTADTADLCDPWIGKFGDIFPHGSDELKALAKFYPEVETRIRPISQGPRTSQAYKAPDLDQVAFDAAMAVMVNGKNRQAAESFRKFIDDFPRSVHRYRARYWLAQAIDRDGDHEKAKKLFEELEHDVPLTYYGMLSSVAIGKPVGGSLDSNLPYGATLDPALSPQETFRLHRAEKLVAEKAYELATIELKELRPRDTLGNPFLYYLAMLNYEARGYGNCFSIIGNLAARGFPSVLSANSIRMVFPLVHLNLIQKYSTETNLDPILVLSLMKQESAFEKTAYSNVGAVGVMQIMPHTASEVEPVSRKDLQEIEPNIRIGMKYLRRLLTRFNGNIVLALAGYNAGPNAADRWVKDFTTKKGMLEFIEQIPYRETREYVSSIVRNYLWYSKKLTPDSVKGLGYFWNVYGPPEKPAELRAPSQATNAN